MRFPYIKGIRLGLNTFPLILLVVVVEIGAIKTWGFW